MLRGDGKDAVKIHRMAVKMDRDDADRARRDERFDLVHLEAISVVDVGEHRFRAAMNERFHRGKRGV